MKNKKIMGFTLIELLIVVAIIAILAAIAIPNFLAAQVRAKVARAKGEVRTLATALESYYIDNNVYPDDIAMEPPSNPWPWYVTSAISTPIAYISTGLISDPFRQGSPSATPDSPGLRYRYLNYDAELNGHWTIVDNQFAETWFPHPGPTSTSVQQGLTVYGKWRLNSAGPDHSAGPGWGYGADLPYDPSNGTISGGDIIRSQVSAEVTQ